MAKRKKEHTIIDTIDGMTPVDAMAVLNAHPTEKASLLTLWKRFIYEDDMPDEIRDMSDGQQLRKLLTLLHKRLIGIKQYKKKGEYFVVFELRPPEEWNVAEIEREDLSDTFNSI